MRARILVAAGVIGLTLAACDRSASPGAEGARVPSGPTAAAPSAAATPESHYDKALRFTRCMNETLEAMYPDAAARGRKVPDPVEGKPLQTWVSVPPGVHQGQAAGAVLEAGGAGWQMVVPEPFEKCKHLLPATWPVKEDPAQLAKEKPFKECLKRHGVQTYEADANGMVHYPIDTSYLDSPAYRAAEDACRHLYDDAANQGGS